MTRHFFHASLTARGHAYVSWQINGGEGCLTSGVHLRIGPAWPTLPLLPRWQYELLIFLLHLRLRTLFGAGALPVCNSRHLGSPAVLAFALLPGALLTAGRGGCFLLSWPCLIGIANALVLVDLGIIPTPANKISRQAVLVLADFQRLRRPCSGSLQAWDSLHSAKTRYRHATTSRS